MKRIGEHQRDGEKRNRVDGRRRTMGAHKVKSRLMDEVDLVAHFAHLAHKHARFPSAHERDNANRKRGDNRHRRVTNRRCADIQNVTQDERIENAKEEDGCQQTYPPPPLAESDTAFKIASPLTKATDAARRKTKRYDC